ncbi:AIP3-domain-containing protein [Epithele typhae]|uniref:AIP3-domain-containing protein n=1 Tax=Epithele typhae TaxID=378194 RepID=UPI002007A286|nr:AIP3-domain-containing protein [Epithele typhae]KAH9912104.1 AIP3-domain-containing protein [Epithele typhae]
MGIALPFVRIVGTNLATSFTRDGEKVDAPTSSDPMAKDGGNGPKAIIKNVDMSEEMQQEAVDVASAALEKYNIEKDIAAQIKKEFDRQHGPTWHVVVGKNFGSYVTHETKHFIYFYIGSLAILIWKPSAPRAGKTIRCVVRSYARSTSSLHMPPVHGQDEPAVESAVTRLLVSIKVLLESLTQWSKNIVDENHELSGVPEDLRSVLESCLSEEATTNNLEIFLPEVRKIITSLLQGLRGKQSIYRRIVSDQKSGNGSDRDSRSSRSVREDGISRQSSRRPTPSNDVPPRSTTPSNSGGFAAPGTMPEDQARSARSSTPVQPRQSVSSSMSVPLPRAYSTSSADPNFPRDPRSQTNGFGTPPPPPDLSSAPPTQAPVPSHVKRFSLVDAPVPSPPTVVIEESATPPPPPPEPLTPNSPPTDSVPLEQAPAVQTSLAALKKAEALERRASKRFSTYNISKMTGGTVRERGGGGTGAGNRRSLLAANGQLTPGDLAALAEDGETASPRKKGTRSQRNRAPAIEEGEEPPPVPPLPMAPSPVPAVVVSSGSSEMVNGLATPEVPREPEYEPGKPFQVFLQVGREVKKVQLEPPLSLSTLRMLFVDRFSYSPGQDNFPPIYIRDPASGVQYELEDVEEVKPKVLLSLNIEPLDQIKQHIDTQISSLQQDIKDLRTAVVSNRRTSTIIAQPMESTPAAPRPPEAVFRDAARRISRMLPDQKTPSKREKSAEPISGLPPTMEPLAPQWTGTTLQPQMTGASEYTTRVVSDLKTQFDEVQNLRRDLGIMRQLYTEFMRSTKDSLGTLRSQTATVKQLASAQVGGARAYIDTGKAKLDTRSSSVLTKMEELQDTVENIKDDVLKRNVSPRTVVLKQVRGDVDAMTQELQSLRDHIQTVKPMWKKTWEEELQNIVEEQQFLQHQEEFLEDLFEDHKAVLEVLGHVEKVISLRGSSSGKRRTPAFKPPLTEEGHGGISTVMFEIRGAAVDPEARMKAIQANERSRAKDLANRTDEFQNELEGFVSGKKLRMTGGAEEVERVRQRRNELTIKAMFNAAGGAGRQRGRTGVG